MYFGDHDFLTLPSKSQLQHDITAMLHGRIRAEQDVLRRLVAAHFRIETVAGAVEELYHQVMAGKFVPV